MGIESPATYGDYYWARQVEANMLLGDETEKALSPAIGDLINSMPGLDKLPPSVLSLLSEIASPKSFAWGSVMARFGSEVADGAVNSSLQPAFQGLTYETNQLLQSTRLDPMAASTLYSRKKIEEDYWLFNMSSAGYDENVAQAAYKAAFPFPNYSDLFLWARYHGSPDNTWSTLVDIVDFDAKDFPLWEWLSLQRLTSEQVQTLHKRGKLTDYEFGDELKQIGWSSDNLDKIFELEYLLPNAMLQVQGNLMTDKSDEQILKDISVSDIHPDYAKKYLDAVLTKPASQDLIAYHLRQDPDLSNLEQDLKRIGIHPKYFDVYKTLAYQIPPVADIITMAVREAFSPAIAARFGQYEDFPAEFAEYAAMKGLSKDWAMRYWAAHWSLPSPQQGFEMLHRGVISDSELDLLLKALDVMPFWRDKLKQIAYRPLTRVDVRRMYREGVLDEREVVESYLNQGYSTENAERMALFTVRQTLSVLAKFTSGDIVKAYSQRMIDKTFAVSLLKEIGIRTADANYIINTAEYKRRWEFTEEKIRGIKNLYKKAEYSENQTRSELNKLNLPSDQIDVLMEQWWYEKKADARATWTTAQTIRFVKEGIITKTRGIEELKLNGYDDEHISVYMSTI
jgi:hypothetical protein